MTPEAQMIRERVASLKRDLASAESRLSSLERTCRHGFDKVVSDPIIRPGYYEPGDPPGTMGIDHRSGFHVPESRTPRWTRTCLYCGKVEETRETAKTVSEAPIFRS